MLHALIALLTLSSASAADLTHQGRLLDATGLPLQGAHTVTLRLYARADASVAVATQTFSDVPVSDGYFAVVLSDIPDSVLAQPLWIGVDPGVGELLPRSPVGTVPTAAISGRLAPRPADGSDSAHPATSRKSLHINYPELASASNWIDPDGSGTSFGPMQVFCDMAWRGGGWTLCYEADVLWGPVQVTGWHSRLNTTARGAGEYARSCRALTAALPSPEARAVYLDSTYIEASSDTAPSLASGAYYELGAHIGTHNIGIEVDYNADPSRGHCFDQDGEDNSWGRAGASTSCFLDTTSYGFYNGMRHVEYWVR